MPQPSNGEPEDVELVKLARRTRLSAPSPVPCASTEASSAPVAHSILPQQIFLQSMREEIEHFLAHADLGAEIDEERRLFDELRLLGEKLNACDFGDALRGGPASPPLAWLKNLLRRLLDPFFRLVLGWRLQRQSQLNTMLVQFQNALAQLEAKSVSVHRHYKAHQINVSKNVLRVLDMLHQSELRLNEKIDLLVEDLDRQVAALRQDVRLRDAESVGTRNGT